MTYFNEYDETGKRAFNALSDSMLGTFRNANTVDVSSVNAWQYAYRQIAGHNASPTCYAAALQKAVDDFIYVETLGSN